MTRFPDACSTLIPALISASGCRSVRYRVSIPEATKQHPAGSGGYSQPSAHRMLQLGLPGHWGLFGWVGSLLQHAGGGSTQLVTPQS